MKLFLGFSVFFWIIILVLLVFGTYFSKTVYAAFYKFTTGKDIGSTFYTTNMYGGPDYRYDVGKSVFGV